MGNMYILQELFINGLDLNWLNIISLLSVMCGVFVITVKNPIISVLYLIALFISIAIYLMILGISFIGLSYILVYVGAVSILFLFILMLINVRVSELITNNNNSLPLATIITSIFITVLLLPLHAEGDIESLNPTIYTLHLSLMSYVNFTYKGNLWLVNSYLWDGKLSDNFHITSIGNIMYTNYPMWLIITSIILLLAMVGSIIITIKQDKV